jgi:hypothetical protein
LRRLVSTSLLAALALAACAERDLWPVERLDPKSAVNVTIMSEPWVYSHDVPMLAANARDYVNLGVIETNRSGKRDYWLGAVQWSTIDRTHLPAAAPAGRPVKVRLAWSGTSLELPAVSGGRGAAGLTDPVFAEPDVDFEEGWCVLTPAQIVQLGAGAPESVVITDDLGRLTTFEPWKVPMTAMSEFLKATGF